jgi:hypothetical protein
VVSVHEGLALVESLGIRLGAKGILVLARELRDIYTVSAAFEFISVVIEELV